MSAIRPTSRRAIFEALMRPAPIVKAEMARQRDFQLAHGLVGVQVDVFVYHALLQPLDEYIVDPASFAMHAHAHAFGQKHLGEIIGGAVA